MRRLSITAAVMAACGAFAAAGTSAPAAASVRVARVVDGDTIALADGRRVRLVQIDTPEVGTGECYSRAAARALRALLPDGSHVSLEADARLDRVDRYGRLLRYVWAGGRNLNVELVRRGAAGIWFYDGDRGKYAAQLLAAGQSALATRRGLWGACPHAVWNPYAAVSTGTSGPAAAPKRGFTGSCDPSYPDVCIPPPPPDLDCADVPYTNIRVLPPDPHHFDGRDDDGLGCES
jgi:micrococcal nuclease